MESEEFNNLSVVVGVAPEYWAKEDFDDFVTVFPREIATENVEVARWSAAEGDPYLIVIFTYLAGPLIQSIITTVTSKIWEKMVEKLSNKMSTKNYPHLTISFRNSTTNINFEITSTDEQTIQKSLHSIGNIINNNIFRNDKEFFYFDHDNKNWYSLQNKKITDTIEGVIAGTQPFEKNGKTIQLTMKDLKGIVASQKGIPMLLGHHGPVVGIVLDVWIENEQVKTKVGLFDDITPEQKEQVKNMKGFSFAGSYSSKTTD